MFLPLEKAFPARPAGGEHHEIAHERYDSGGILPVVKHFPGLGGASGNTDYGLATTVPLAQLQIAGLVPFRTAIAAG